MKAIVSLLLGLFLCISLNLSAQSDADNYWIKENFSSFTIQSNWVVAETDYETYPNNYKITTRYANVEETSHSARQLFPEANQFRIRGLDDNGFLQFTVPNAEKVKIFVTGKSDLEDRTIKIYRNDELIKEYKGMDRTKCGFFVDEVQTNSEVTYKVTAGIDGTTDPVAVFYVEVLKYGKEDPQVTEDQGTYWIKEDFSQFTSTTSYIQAATDYASYPNAIAMTAVYANVEENGDCAIANKGVGNQLRIRGLDGNGSLSFTLPNAGIVRIHVTGKSSAQDRNVRIYRNNALIETFENMDNDVCRIFEDSIFTQQTVTYKVTAGTEDVTSPIAVYYIEAEKYYDRPTPGDDYSAYWIYEDFNLSPIETGYASNVYKSFPNNINITSSFANVEWGDGCSTDNNIVRLSGKTDERTPGVLEFTVPDYAAIAIGVTGKSSQRDRDIEVYINNVKVASLYNLDRDVCEEIVIDQASETSATIRITGVENAASPVAVNYIQVKKNGYSSIREPERIVSIFPNPASEMIYFNTPEGNNVDEVAVYDIAGKKVYTAFDVDKLNISGLPKGIYITRMQCNSAAYAYKLIKQ